MESHMVWFSTFKIYILCTSGFPYNLGMAQNNPGHRPSIFFCIPKIPVSGVNNFEPRPCRNLGSDFETVRLFENFETSKARGRSTSQGCCTLESAWSATLSMCRNHIGSTSSSRGPTGDHEGNAFHRGLSFGNLWRAVTRFINLDLKETMAFNSKRSPIKGRLNQLSRVLFNCVSLVHIIKASQRTMSDYVRLRRVLSSLFAWQFAEFEKLREEICCQKQRLPNRGPGDTTSQRIVWRNPGLKHSQDCQNVFCVCVCASLCNKYSKTQNPSNYFLTRGNRGGWYLEHVHCPRYPHFLAGNSEGFVRPLGHWSLLHADRRPAAHWWRHFLVGLQSHWCQGRSGMRTIDQCWRCTKIPFAAHMRGHICSTQSCSMSTAFRWHPWAAQVSLQARAPCRQGQPQPRPRRTRYGGPWRCNGALPSQLEKPKCSEWRFGYVSSKNWYPDVPRWTSKWLVNGAGALGVLGAVVLRSKYRTNMNKRRAATGYHYIPLAPMTLGCFGS